MICDLNRPFLKLMLISRIFTELISPVINNNLPVVRLLSILTNLAVCNYNDRPSNKKPHFSPSFRLLGKIISMILCPDFSLLFYVLDYFTLLCLYSGARAKPNSTAFEVVNSRPYSILGRLTYPLIRQTGR